ncbi:MAG TPA: heme-binding protein [Verrucomicrobiae bacterium]|jgi:glc operon protein GlcG|nr:heme-binding protein [Verrucomicrobiae bacterium]
MAHVTHHHSKLTLEGAEAIVAAAKAQAARMNVPMNIAVVDDGGHLLAFARMDGAKPASIDIAINKAVAAAIRRQNTGPARSGNEVSVLLSLGLAIGSRARQTPIRGGLMLEVNGECVGGIGVSAGTEDEDTEVARAGVAAFVKA